MVKLDNLKIIGVDLAKNADYSVIGNTVIQNNHSNVNDIHIISFGFRQQFDKTTVITMSIDGEEVKEERAPFGSEFITMNKMTTSYKKNME